MYQPDDQDRVRRLPEVPQTDVGAPLPVVVADEGTVLLAFHVRPKPTLEELVAIEIPQIVYSDTPGSIALVSFKRTYASYFGPPNDEAFDGHPLAARGLEPYGAFEIEGSSWIREAERRNRGSSTPPPGRIRQPASLCVHLPRLDRRGSRRRLRCGDHGGINSDRVAGDG